MFCGSCMHDNTWAKSLIQKGIEVSLIPTYTPIRVDEENRSLSHVYMGGINVYLDFQFPLWQKLPLWSKKWLDHPRVLDFVTRWGISNDAKKLGPLTLAMLEGEAGPNKKEIDELVQFISRDLKPDVVCFSNSLLVGILKPLKRNYSGKIITLLQGEDIFLDELIEPYKEKAISLIQQQVKEYDAYLVHSQYYRNYMKEYLRLDEKKIHRLPLGVDLSGHDGKPSETSESSFTVGYLARICPEKGLHNLVSAFEIFHKEFPDTCLKIAGYLDRRNQKYLEDLLKKHDPQSNFIEYEGSPKTHQEKVKFLQNLDLFSLPTDYHEPKGISVIEAMANGIPVVQPAHGAFPEMIKKTGGGILYQPNEPENLVVALKEMYLNPQKRTQFAEAGHQSVHNQYSLEAMAEESISVFNTILSQ